MYTHSIPNATPEQAAPAMPAKYRTTSTACSCPDFYYRSLRNPQHRCKHMIALSAPDNARCHCCKCGIEYLFSEEPLARLYCHHCRRQEAIADTLQDYYDTTSRALLAFE